MRLVDEAAPAPQGRAGISRREARIPIAVGTLNKLATIGGGPVMQYVGRIPLYAIADLDAWAAAKLSPPVSSTAQRA